MNINIITIGTKMPDWVDSAYSEYAQRLQSFCRLNLITLPLGKRTKTSNPEDAKKQESKAILDKLTQSDYLVLLDSRGRQFSSEGFAEYINNLRVTSKNIYLVIGGPDGFATDCYHRANDQISLSKLTLPHPIARVVLTEQLYRAFAILNHHPYHK
ncbi:MAG: 23S rRNA (pseudouridine(1915)-N(3))-methyltransferase RlmH [Gammaproteobacteria bacterium]|nr:23S rRNA (pseudouridine(1915)-N(3))-methyltransferase RlmH [Gammaproteobacteria bacterium]